MNNSIIEFLEYVILKIMENKKLKNLIDENSEIKDDEIIKNENVDNNYNIKERSCNNIYKMTPFPQTELREIEQYFFSENVIQNIVEALDYENNIICLGTPAVADGFYKFKNQRNSSYLFRAE